MTDSYITPGGTTLTPAAGRREPVKQRRIPDWVTTHSYPVLSTNRPAGEKVIGNTARPRRHFEGRVATGRRRLTLDLNQQTQAPYFATTLISNNRREHPVVRERCYVIT